MIGGELASLPRDHNTHLWLAQGYVWFLPGWFKEDWYDIDKLQEKEKLEEQNASSDTSR